MAFRPRKLFGTFEKRVPGVYKSRTGNKERIKAKSGGWGGRGGDFLMSLGPFSRKTKQLSGHVKPLFNNLYLKTNPCMEVNKVSYFCYGFPGAETFRNLRETDPWTVHSQFLLVLWLFSCKILRNIAQFCAVSPHFFCHLGILASTLLPPTRLILTVSDFQKSREKSLNEYSVALLYEKLSYLIFLFSLGDFVL